MLEWKPLQHHEEFIDQDPNECLCENEDHKLGYSVLKHITGRYSVWFYAGYEDLDKACYLNPNLEELEETEEWDNADFFWTAEDAKQVAEQHYNNLQASLQFLTSRSEDEELF